MWMNSELRIEELARPSNSSLPISRLWPVGIAAGPRGRMWFTGVSRYFGYIGVAHPSLVIEEIFEIPSLTSRTSPGRIVAGTEGEMWFTDDENCAIGRITESGDFTFFPIESAAPLGGIAVDSDGDVWFASGDEVGRISAGGDLIRIPVGQNVCDLTLGLDGSMWFVGKSLIGVIDPDGSIYRFPFERELTCFDVEIASASDGSMWVADRGCMWKLDMDGHLVAFPATGGFQNGPRVCSAFGGGVWFSQEMDSGDQSIVKLSHMDAAGNVSQVSSLRTTPRSIALGEFPLYQESIWVTEFDLQSVAVIWR